MRTTYTRGMLTQTMSGPRWLQGRHGGLRTAALAFMIAALLAVAFAMPITLSSGLINKAPVVARYFCPETGKLAPTYFKSRSSRSPSVLQACLDSSGKRIENRDTHTLIIFSASAFWFVFIFPLLFLMLRPLFSAPVRRTLLRDF